MAEVTSFTADRIQAIEAAGITGGALNSSGHLILDLQGGGTLDLGVISPPAGSVVMSAAAVVPTGWLLCDGSAISRTTYAALFAAIGTTYGAGNGTSTFNLPNVEAKFPRMEAAARGGTGGAAVHTHSVPAHAHTLEGGSTPAHAHITIATVAAPNIWIERLTSGFANWTATQQADISPGAGSTNSLSSGAKVSGVTAQSSAGTSGTPSAADLPPYVNFNFIIKT
jgi:microcystin-dependent protein